MRQMGFLFFSFYICAALMANSLIHDLETVKKWKDEERRTLPLFKNVQGQAGYFNMPSARMHPLGLSWGQFHEHPPYKVTSLGFQFFSFLELSANYWIFKGKLEPHFGADGFGDDAERSANVKLALHQKEQTQSFLPSLALGWNDFFGTKRFYSFYAVATQTFESLGLECTLGYGKGRIRGLFAAFSYVPFFFGPSFLQPCTLSIEYDANNYKHHPFEHSEGRNIVSRFNGGFSYQLGSFLQTSVYSVRGKEVAASFALQYNFGETKGLFPKIFDPPFYTAPQNLEPIGSLRTYRELAKELAFALKDQGLNPRKIFLCPDSEERLFIQLINQRYPFEDTVRERILSVLSRLIPANVTSTTVIVESDGLPIHEYTFSTDLLQKKKYHQVGSYEFGLLSRQKNHNFHPFTYDCMDLFLEKNPLWKLTFHPIFRSYFGSSSGKFKFDTGLTLGLEGYITDFYYYSLNSSYTIKSNSQGLGSFDRLNPSQIINVRSDQVLYHQSSSFHLDEAYLQRSWNLGRGFFVRLAGGFFETAYGGFAAEGLYFPARANWAIGLQIAPVWKREYHGLGIRHTVRKLLDTTPIQVPYQGLQFFLDLHYQFQPLHLDFLIKGGRFLAKDWGVRLEASRTFFSGLSVGFWYTLTNAEDRFGKHLYFDKGVLFSLPLEIFLNKSSKDRIGYAVAAWLRDAGAIAKTGKELYPTIYYERFQRFEEVHR